MKQVLTIDAGGVPVGWIHWQEAATLYARDSVKWEAGETWLTVHGGHRDDGLRSSLRINSIIAVPDKSFRFERTPPLSNKTLFQRDANICLYCGEHFPDAKLTRDHVRPRAQRGPDTWENLATCCRNCNRRKGARTPEAAGMPLLAVPYKPDYFSYLLLIASGRVTGDQQAWLEAFANKKARTLIRPN